MNLRYQLVGGRAPAVHACVYPCVTSSKQNAVLLQQQQQQGADADDVVVNDVSCGCGYLAGVRRAVSAYLRLTPEYTASLSDRGQTAARNTQRGQTLVT